MIQLPPGQARWFHQTHTQRWGHRHVTQAGTRKRSGSFEMQSRERRYLCTLNNLQSSEREQRREAFNWGVQLLSQELLRKVKGTVHPKRVAACWQSVCVWCLVKIALFVNSNGLILFHSPKPRCWRTLEGCDSALKGQFAPKSKTHCSSYHLVV